jgi:hypothetical protein
MGYASERDVLSFPTLSDKPLRIGPFRGYSKLRDGQADEQAQRMDVMSKITMTAAPKMINQLGI